MVKVMVFGTFDILHRGHENFFQQAKKHGRPLIVCLARDKNILKIKKHKPCFDEKKRQKALQKTGWVDKVVLGDKSDFLKPIVRYNPTVICLGYDQKVPFKGLLKELRKRKLKIKIVRMKSFQPRKFKSSILRKKYVRP